MPDPNSSREYLGVLGPAIDGKSVTAMVYETSDMTTSGQREYYFCCRVCGQCGKHWLGADYAVVQAAQHMTFFDHTPYMKEHDHGEGQ